MTTKTLQAPRLATSDKLLSSTILLPKDVLVSCFVYTPLAGPSSHSRAYNDILELARRQVHTHNGSATLARSILTSVHLGGSDSCMYAFKIGREGHPPAELSSLQFDGLIVSSQTTFTPADIYPCCSSCSQLAAPCPACLEPTPATQQHLPRQPLRVVYSHFLEAVRSRLIDDIAEASNSKQSTRKRLVKRLKGGFLLGPLPSSTEWSKGWDSHASSRPLIFCQLQIHLASFPQPQLIIHPQLHTTPFLLLPHGPGRPLSEGAPITLLPHGIPAFFLASYSGPTSALRRQFRESLSGMGVSGWDGEEGLSDDYWFSSKTHSDGKPTTFIIAWISVENKQGEDKGITVIYPSSLCLSFVPSSTSASQAVGSFNGRREPLAYIPELPAQLQPSPQVTAAVPATSNLFPPAAHAVQLLPSMRPSSCPATTSPYALRAFRALTLSRSKGLRHVAAEVNGYVDSVAREREKERERLRREREREGGSPHLARANIGGATGVGSIATPAATPVTPGAATVPVTPQPASTVVPPPVAGPSQQPNPIQAPSTFYPSPPQNPPFPAPPSEMTSPAAEPTPMTLPAAAPTTLIPPAPSAQAQTQPLAPAAAPAPTGFEFDSQYIDMSMAMDGFDGMSMMGMDMGMNFGMDGGADGQRGATAMDFDTDFTDDDFNFFDRPENPHPGAGLTPAAGPAPLGMGGMMMGLGMSPSVFGGDTSSPDWPGAYTPGTDLHHMMTIPDLLPPSPGETPNSQGASMPATPNVQLAEDDAIIRRPRSSLGISFGIFDPIPFAQSHRLADGKYAMGKFALPSPPPEEDERFSFMSGNPATRSTGGNLTQDNGWRSKYNSVTDPRIGVVRKLIGVKRKSTSNIVDGGLRARKTASPSWVREHEDWEGTNPEEEEAKSEPESEEDDAEEDSPLVSRPSTPPPAYLPLGPTLLHTQFQHSYLLPLSTPLRPPGAAVAPTNITTLMVASASVPTPVSPAATLGAASEKSKSLEAAAFAVGKEVVENSVWADAWRTTTLSMGSRQPRDVWATDVKSVHQLLQLVPDVQGPLDMETLFDLGPPASKGLQTLESPMISIGKADAVIQILPTALRFWEKLGLAPRGGKKDATVFVLFEDTGDERQELVESWMAKIAAIYNCKHLGILTPGKHNACPKDGVFSLRFDSTFRKSLAVRILTVLFQPPSWPVLTAPGSNIVLYIVTPTSTLSLSSPLLRQIFSSVKKALKTHEGSQTLFQFVPEPLIACSTGCNPASHIADLETFFKFGEPIRNYFHDPAYTLARPLHSAVKYARRPKAPLDVVDAGTFLHVGYGFSECGKWILSACVDQRGEAHDLAVWLTQTQTQSQTPNTDGEEADAE
ncbi:hypothetical protein C8J57DRAFT_1460386, partial [Mycena rebaudengoi]